MTAHPTNEKELSYGFDLDDWGNFSLYSDEYDHTDYVIDSSERILKITLPPIVLIIALFGNIFCLKTFWKLSTGPFPSCGFLMTLTVLDIFLLVVHCGNGWYESLRGFNLLKTMKKRSDLNCKVFSFLTNLAVALYNWLMVVIAGEMYYLHRRPHAAINLTSSYVKDTLAILAVVFMCVNIHYFWTIGIVSIAEDLKGFGRLVDDFCMFTIASISGRPNAPDLKFAHWWQLLDTTLSVFMPLGAVFVLLLMYVSTRRRHTPPQNEDNDVTVPLKSAYELRQQFHLSTELINTFTQTVYPVLGLTFLICNLPHYTIRTFDVIKAKPLDSAAWTLVLSICQQLQYSFYAIKIVIFMLKSPDVSNVTGATLKNSWQCAKRLAQCCNKFSKGRQRTVVYQEVMLL